MSLSIPFSLSERGGAGKGRTCQLLWEEGRGVLLNRNISTNVLNSQGTYPGRHNDLNVTGVAAPCASAHLGSGIFERQNCA